MASQDERAQGAGWTTARRCALLAAVAYLGIAIWVYRDVLADPTELLPAAVGEKGTMTYLTSWDQNVGVAMIARNARTLLTEPWSYLNGFQCYPLPRSHTVGEHMFGNGLLAAVPYLVTGDPIATFNILLMLSLWIPALSMYFFSREFVRSPAAAFVAGLIFALAPVRVFNVEHPYANADLWTPAALLFLHRLFAYGGVRNALAFSLFASLEVAQSLYPLLSCAVLLLFYSCYLAYVHRRRLREIAPLLVLSLVVLAGVSWLVFGPYLHTRDTWGLLSGRKSLPLLLSHVPWAHAAVVLGLLAVVDRLRGPRLVAGEDPRLCFVAAGIFLFWGAIGPVILPGSEIALPSPRSLIRMLPGADAVRGLYTLSLGGQLAMAFLCGYGVLLLVERAPRRIAIAVAAVLGVLVLAERFYPPVSGRVLATAQLRTRTARPPEDDIALLRRTSGPVLYLPYPTAATLKAFINADYLLLTSYSLRATAACYASFASPLDAQVEGLANALPDPRAADALYALGFRTVMVDEPSFWRPYLKRFKATLETDPESARRLEAIGRSERFAAYRLSSPVAAATDLAMLAGSGSAEPASAVVVAPGPSSIEFDLVNHQPRTFRLPDPIEPTALVARWRRPSDAGDAAPAVAEQHTRALLPVALAPQAHKAVAIELDVPARTGAFVVSIAPASRPDLVLSRRLVRIDSASPSGAGAPAPS